MRLNCPNCDAQYEVADDAVPSAGRDVQCSNCGHAWFQLPAGSETVQPATELLQEPVDVAPADKAPPVQIPAVADPDARPESVRMQVADSDEDEDEDENDRPTEGDASSFGGPPALKPRVIDEAVVAVLREEAERETAARRRDAEVAVAEGKARASGASPVVTIVPSAVAAVIEPAPPPPVPYLGSTEAITMTTGVPPITSDPRDGIDDDPFAVAASRPGKRRDRLPDIDAIKSTLQSSTDRPDADADLLDEPYDPPRRTGFRAGFFLTVGVGIILAVAYVTAPGIIARFPAAGPTLGAYVGGVDEARLWLDGMARRASDSLKAQGSGGTVTD